MLNKKNVRRYHSFVDPKGSHLSFALFDYKSGNYRKGIDWSLFISNCNFNLQTGAFEEHNRIVMRIEFNG